MSEKIVKEGLTLWLSPEKMEKSNAQRGRVTVPERGNDPHKKEVGVLKQTLQNFPLCRALLSCH